MEVLQRTANRGSISTGYDIDNSAAFGGANGIQFNPSSDGNRRTWTVSLWVKRSELSVETTIFGSSSTSWAFMDPDWLRFGLHTGSAIYYYDTDNTGTVFRDTSAWYHLVFQLDTTQAVAANRTKLYINGELYTGARGGGDTSANIPQNTEMTMSLNTSNIQVGYYYAGNEQLDGYMSEIHFTDGVANDADAFGEYDADSGIWKPKAYAGSYGTNGFYLEFKEPAASATGIGKDTSGNGHNFSTGGAYPSQATDTPTNSFCTLNPIFQSYGTYDELTISKGATRAVNAASAYKSATSTIGVSTGKWYWEVNITDRNVITTIGVTMPFYWNQGNLPFGGTVYYGQTGQRHNNSVAGGGQDSFGNGYTDGDIISFALDMDATTPTLAVRKNNSLVTGNNATGNLMYGLSLTGSGGTFLPPKEDFYFAKLVGYGANTFDINFGGYTAASISSAASDENGYGTFEYAPPSGYYALCTKNLAEYG